MKGPEQNSQPSEAAPVITQARREHCTGLDGKIWGRWGLRGGRGERGEGWQRRGLGGVHPLLCLFFPTHYLFLKK